MECAPSFSENSGLQTYFRLRVNKHLREELITEAWSDFHLYRSYDHTALYKYRRVCLPIYVL